MNRKKRIKDLRRQLRKDGDNLPIRLELAELCRDTGETQEALELFSHVAFKYYEMRDLDRARTACKAVLDMLPGQKHAVELLKVIELALRSKRASSEVDDHAVKGKWVPTLAKGASGGDPAEVEASPARPSARPRAERFADGVGADSAAPKVASSVDGDASMEMYQPTPLPAPLAPHDADDEDSMVEGLERYNLPIARDLSGPVPAVTLPEDVEPMGAELGEDADADEKEETTHVGVEDNERFRTEHSEVEDFIDPDPDTANISVRVSDRVSTEPVTLPPGERDEGSDGYRRPPTQLPADDPVHQEFAEWPAGTDLTDQTYAVSEYAPSAPEDVSYDAAPKYAPGVPEDVSYDATTRIAKPSLVAIFPDDVRVSSSPHILLPERMDGLPLVIHDDMELTEAFVAADLEDRHQNQGGAPLAAFSELPEEALGELAERMVLRHYAAEEYIVRQEERARSCFAVVSGQASVYHYDPLESDGDYEELYQLRAGDLFGESCLLPARHWRAGVRADTDSSVYEIPRRLLRELAAVHPGVNEALEQMYRARLLDGLLASHPLLRGLTPAQAYELRGRFHCVTYQSGDVVMREGEDSGGLCVVVLGAADVAKRLSRRRAALLATLEEGSYFCDMAPLRGTPACVTISAAGPLEVWHLPADDLRPLIDAGFEVWEDICARRAKPALERNYLLTSAGVMV